MGSHCSCCRCCYCAWHCFSHHWTHFLLQRLYYTTCLTRQKLVPPPQPHPLALQHLSVSQKLQTASTFVVTRMADVAPEQQVCYCLYVCFWRARSADCSIKSHIEYHDHAIHCLSRHTHAQIHLPNQTPTHSPFVNNNNSRKNRMKSRWVRKSLKPTKRPPTWPRPCFPSGPFSLPPWPCNVHNRLPGSRPNTLLPHSRHSCSVWALH